MNTLKPIPIDSLKVGRCFNFSPVMPNKVEVLGINDCSNPLHMIDELERRKRLGREVATKLIAEKAAHDKRLLREKLSDEAMFSISYVPYVIAEVAWDYVDSILNLAALMRLSETKSLCRKLKEIHREYDRERFKIIDDSSRKTETDNMILFQEELSDFFGNLHKSVIELLTEMYGTIEDNTSYLVGAAYACRIVLKSLARYCEAQEKIVSSILGYSIAGTLYPKKLRAVEILVIEFAGDLKLDGKEYSEKEKWYVEELAKYIADVELNDIDKSKTKQQPTRMTMEEMKSLMASIKAEIEVFQNNLELNVSKGNKAAGVRARKSSLQLEKLFKQYRKNSVK